MSDIDDDELYQKRKKLAENILADTGWAIDVIEGYANNIDRLTKVINKLNEYFADPRTSYYGFDEQGYERLCAWENIRDEVLFILREANQ